MAGPPTFEVLLAGHAEGVALEKLAAYAKLLERWSARHNLVRYRDRQELVERHIADALAAAPQLADSGSLLDIGSGAGLPGVPLLIVRPGWRGFLLEPRQKRWAFLRLVVRELDLMCSVERGRYQELESGRRWELITARAVGGHPELLSWASNHLVGDGAVLLWTTEEVEAQLRQLGGWRVLSSALPALDRGQLCRLERCST